MNKKGEDEPHAKRRGWLKNGNIPGDPSKAKRCGAKTRRSSLCQSPAMKNGRCRMHGGKSTGPKTKEGIERIKESRSKHGEYSKVAKESRKSMREFLRQADLVLFKMRDDISSQK